MFRSAARAFFGALFGLLGVFVGVLIVAIILATLVFSGAKEAKVTGKYTVLPDADGKRKELTHSSPLILVVSIEGPIGHKLLCPEEIQSQLERSQQGSFSDRVQGVILQINSPGGSAFASDTIYRLVKQYKERYKVPVYAYVDGLCASGGYYIGCAADKIFASNISLIGSVGVISNYMNFTGTLDKLGVKALTITRGEEKDPLNPLRPWKEGEEKESERIMTYIYDVFVDVVTTNRSKISRDELVKDFGARVWPAPEAIKKGYIDGLAESRNQVLSMLIQDTGLDGKFYQVVQMDKRTWIDQLFGTRQFFEIPGLSKDVGPLYLYKPNP